MGHQTRLWRTMSQPCLLLLLNLLLKSCYWGIDLVILSLTMCLDLRLGFRVWMWTSGWSGKNSVKSSHKLSPLPILLEGCCGRASQGLCSLQGGGRVAVVLVVLLLLDSIPYNPSLQFFYTWSLHSLNHPLQRLFIITISQKVRRGWWQEFH